VLTGCPTPAQLPQEQFERQLHAFHADMRWGRYEDAAAYIEVADRAEFEGLCDEYYDDDFQITEYEFEDIDYQAAVNQAEVEVWVQWMRLPSTSMQETRYRELWVWNDDLSAWQITEREELEDD
jgi:hypothetical protein